jgi:hypothetical protein
VLSLIPTGLLLLAADDASLSQDAAPDDPGVDGREAGDRRPGRGARRATARGRGEFLLRNAPFPHEEARSGR